MSPVFVQIVGQLVRYLLIGIGTTLINKGVLTNDQFDWVVTGLVTIIGTVVWGLWVKYRARLKMLVGFASENTMTEKEAEAIVKAKMAPSSRTPKDEVPTLTPPKV